MEQKLTEGQSTAIVALLQKRNEVVQALDEYIELLGAKYGFEAAVIQQRQDGLWLMEKEETGAE